MRALPLCLGGLLFTAPLMAQTAPPPSPAAERDAALQLAAAEAAAGRPAEAARRLRDAAERFHSVKALLELARLQGGEKDGAAAMGTLRQALGIAPNSEEVLSAYAQLALASGAPVPAIMALEPLTRMHPSMVEHRYLLGVALIRAGDMPAAVEALRQAERREPNRPLTLIALGLALNRRQLYAEAKPYLTRSLELDPESVEAMATLAEAEEGLGELESAEGHARRALARAGDQPTANLVMGMVLMGQERYAEAREALEKAVAADPASAKAHYQLSLACARGGDETSARQHLELYQKLLKDVEKRLEELRGPAAPIEGSARR